MEFTRAGIILFTEHYAACVAFYRDTLTLPVMFALDSPDSTLTCLDLGGAYLMIEPGGRSNPEGKGLAETSVKLRLNVEDLDAALATLTAKGVAIERLDFPWGSVANFRDPDGNPCQLRSERGFGA